MRNKIIFAMLLAGLGLGKISGASPVADALTIGTQPIFGAPSPTNTSIYVPPALSVPRALTQGACGFVGMSGILWSIWTKRKTPLALLMICGLGFLADTARYPMGKTHAKNIALVQFFGGFVAGVLSWISICCCIAFKPCFERQKAKFERDKSRLKEQSPEGEVGDGDDGDQN